MYSYLAVWKFYAENDIFRVETHFQVREAYMSLVVTPAVLETITTVLSVAVVCVILRTMIVRYTGSHGVGSYRYTVEELLQIRRRQLGNLLILPLVLAVASFVCHVLYYRLLPTHEMFWIVDIIVAAALVIFTNLRLRDVRDDLDMTRMLGSANVQQS